MPLLYLRSSWATYFNADVYFSCVQVDAAIILMLFAEKFHIASLSFGFEKIGVSLLLPDTIWGATKEDSFCAKMGPYIARQSTKYSSSEHKKLFRWLL